MTRTGIVRNLYAERVAPRPFSRFTAAESELVANREWCARADKWGDIHVDEHGHYRASGFRERVCAIDGKTLPITGDTQSGWWCCDRYYCSQECLDKSFEGTGQTWREHFDEQEDEDSSFSSSDCYWTEWYRKDDELERAMEQAA